MFARRLILLGGLFALGAAAIAGQLARLTLHEGERLRAEAERRLVRSQWLPTSRGRILDRHGRVLAVDRASYELAVDYAVLDGSWARDRGRRIARRLHRDAWADLSAEQRRALTEAYAARFADHAEAGLALVAEAMGIEPAELDRRRAEVVERVTATRLSVAERARERLIAERRAAGLPLEPDDIQRLETLADQPVAEENTAHALAEALDDAVGFRLLRLTEQTSTLFFTSSRLPGRWQAATEEELVEVLPGVSVRNAAERLYPSDDQTVVLDRASFPPPLASPVPVEVAVRSVTADIVGSVRSRVFKEDADARADALAKDTALADRSRTPAGVDRGRYFEGDSVGHSGIERAHEATLRGLRGLRSENLETRVVTERPPETGRDVRLTIDAALQARVRAILDPAVGLARVQPWQHNETLGVGTSLFGAAVVLDVQTGEVLAMVSTPAEPRDGDWSALGITDDATLSLFRQIYHPEFNRAVGRPYPPGSIAKAMILCGAVQRGVYAPGERIHDQGYLIDGRPDILRSWIFKQFGITHSEQLGRDPDGVDALMVSANVFFFTLGQRLGTRGITEVYREFGVGEAFGFGLGTEWPGKIGPFDGPGDGSDLEPWDAIQLGIGQGPATWTPMHAAAAYAAIARGGVLVRPRLLLDGSAPEARELGIPPAAVAMALEGLWGAVNDPEFGTGHAFSYVEKGPRVPIFNAPGVRVWGKTGTATASPIVVDPDGDGPAAASVALSGDHSWFLVLAGEQTGPPRYAISVLMEYAGSGGRVSGPIANQIIHALVEEGYLAGDRRADAAGAAGAAP